MRHRALGASSDEDIRDGILKELGVDLILSHPSCRLSRGTAPRTRRKMLPGLDWQSASIDRVEPSAISRPVLVNEALSTCLVLYEQTVTAAQANESV